MILILVLRFIGQVISLEDAKTLYVVDSRQSIVGTRADFEHMYLTACITP